MIKDKNVFRFETVSKIDNKFLRRLSIVAVLPFIMMLNFTLAFLYSIMVFLTINNELFRSAKLRWNIKNEQ
jgi:hypothetical protein